MLIAVMQTIDGRKLAREIRAQVKKEIAEHGIVPGLGVILVGADPASHLYVSLKERAAREVGIHFEKYLFPATESEDKIIVKIQELNARPDIHAMLVQLPLPQPMNEDRIMAAMDPRKDVDGFHPENIKKLEARQPYVIPGVLVGIMKLIESAGKPASGANAVILANSATFAKPLEALLHEAKANAITLISPSQEAASPWTRQADIIVIALGRAGFLTSNMVKDGAIIIDVGANKKETGELVGDADSASFRDRNVWITPVPGGVGPMTVAILLQNVVALAQKSL